MVGGLDLGWLQTVGRKWDGVGATLDADAAARHPDSRDAARGFWMDGLNEALLLARRQPWMNGENPTFLSRWMVPSGSTSFMIPSGSSALI